MNNMHPRLMNHQHTIRCMNHITLFIRKVKGTKGFSLIDG